MIVDPNTGLPVEESLGQGLISHIPSASVTTMWNMRRVSNTMTRGARRGWRARTGVSDISTVQGSIASQLTGGRSTSVFRGGRGFRQTFSPMNFNRLGGVHNIEPPTGSHGYTPFNVLARAGNSGVSRLQRRNPAMAARWFGAAGEDGTWFSPGTMGRLSTMGRVYGSSDKALAKMAPHIQDAFRELNPTQYTHAFTRNTMAAIPDGGYGGMARKAMGLDNVAINAFGRNETAQMAGMSMRGSFSQKIAGYVHGSQMSAKGVGAVEARSLAGEGSNFAKGVMKQASHLAEDSGPLARFAAKNARFIAPAARALGPIGTALLVRDIALMSGKVFASAAKTAIDAGNSIKGSIDKPIMGMGFRDNSIAATSRQRGVMAIQNSRLNMRSVLGNEAAGIHAAWG